MQRRTFLQASVAASVAASAAATPVVMTVRGPVDPTKMGVMLVHEHLFSNFGEEPAEPPAPPRAPVLQLRGGAGGATGLRPGEIAGGGGALRGICEEAGLWRRGGRHHGVVRTGSAAAAD